MTFGEKIFEERFNVILCHVNIHLSTVQSTMRKFKGSAAYWWFEPLVCLVTNFMVCSYFSFAIFSSDRLYI